MSITPSLKKTGDTSSYPQEVKKTKSEIETAPKTYYQQALEIDLSKIEDVFKKCQEFKKEDLYDKENLCHFVKSIYALPRNPKALLDNPIYSLQYNLGESKILELNECACKDASRSSSAPGLLGTRSRGEEQILNKIQEHHGQKKEDILRIMSFGCGGCLSDWMIAVQLILLGFSQIELHLIDRDSGSQFWQNNLKKFLENFPEVKVTLHSYSTLEEFGEKNITLDLAYAMDLDRSKYADADEHVKLHFSTNGFTFVTKCTPHWDAPNAKKYQLND